jgi:hypothetical protein
VPFYNIGKRKNLQENCLHLLAEFLSRKLIDGILDTSKSFCDVAHVLFICFLTILPEGRWEGDVLVDDDD